MSLYKFVDTLEEIGYTLRGDVKQHFRFVQDAKLLTDAIIAEFQQNGSIFQGYMGELGKTATLAREMSMDIPMCFDIFLPVRLPFSLTPSFNEAERSVQFSKKQPQHPFFFGNALNAKCINIRLQQDLKRAIEKIPRIKGFWGAVYDIEYNSLSFNRVPFVHQVCAVQRGAVNRCIHIDFIFALEFDGVDMPLPRYYDAPIRYKWLAYGRVCLKKTDNSADWAVVLPRWRSAQTGVCMRSQNTLLLLYRLLYSQRCFIFAAPLLVKFCFIMTIVDRGEDYKKLTAAELMITTLGHLVFRNICEVIVCSTVGDVDSNTLATQELRKQQIMGKGLFGLMSRGLQLNAITGEFITKYFQINYVPQKEQKEQKEQHKPPTGAEESAGGFTRKRHLDKS